MIRKHLARVNQNYEAILTIRDKCTIILPPMISMFTLITKLCHSIGILLTRHEQYNDNGDYKYF